jgi:hypothetical protein
VPSLLSAPLTAKAAVRASGPSMVMGLTQTPVSQLERDPYRSAEDRAWTRGNPWGQWHNPFDPIHYDAPYSPRGKALDGYQVYEANGRAYGDYSSINGYGGYGGVGGIGGYGGYGGYGYSRMGGGMRVGGGMGYGYGGGGYGGYGMGGGMGGGYGRGMYGGMGMGYGRGYGRGMGWGGGYGGYGGY